MKFKNIVFLLFVFIFFACNNTGSPGNEIKDTAAEKKELKEPAIALTLNNGEKWQGDESTRNHVMKLSNIFREFKAKSRSGISDYQLLASEAREELDGLIRDCKMSGPDHDALHLWLEPVLKSTADLKNAKSMEEAEVISGAIIEDIDKFNTYFK